MRENFQEINTQNVYAVTLAFKVFRFLITLVTAFDLNIRQLNAKNAFLNAKNNKFMYCFLSDNYKRSEKIMKMLWVLYNQRKFLLL